MEGHTPPLLPAPQFVSTLKDSMTAAEVSESRQERMTGGRRGEGVTVGLALGD